MNVLSLQVLLLFTGFVALVNLPPVKYKPLMLSLLSLGFLAWVSPGSAGLVVGMSVLVWKAHAVGGTLDADKSLSAPLTGSRLTVLGHTGKSPKCWAMLVRRPTCALTSRPTYGPVVLEKHCHPSATHCRPSVCWGPNTNSIADGTNGKWIPAFAGMTKIHPAIIIFVIVITLLAYRSLSHLNTDWLPNEFLLLGAAFYCLRMIHYVVERHLGNLPEHNFWHFLAYVIFFPTLMAGPIHRFKEFVEDVNLEKSRLSGCEALAQHGRRILLKCWATLTRRPTYGLTSGGGGSVGRLPFRGADRDLSMRCAHPTPIFQHPTPRIIFGLFKINFLAGWLVMQFKPHNLSIDTFAFQYLDCFTYGLKLYWQFSGLTDLAIGFGLMMGIRLPENFNWPFLQKNITKFWQAWHMSLSSWCREYVYLPVVAKTRMPNIAVVCSMLAIGLWHAVSVKYLVWALYHGIGIVGYRVFLSRLGDPPSRSREGGRGRVNYEYPHPSLPPQAGKGTTSAHPTQLLWQHRRSATRLRGADVISSTPHVRTPAGLRLTSWLWQLLAIFTTFHFVLFSFVITKEESLAASRQAYLSLIKGVWQWFI